MQERSLQDYGNLSVTSRNSTATQHSRKLSLHFPQVHMLGFLPKSYQQHLHRWSLQLMLQLWDEISQHLALLDQLTLRLFQVMESISLLLHQLLQLLLLFSVQKASQFFKTILDTLDLICIWFFRNEKEWGTRLLGRDQKPEKEVFDLEVPTGKGDRSRRTILGEATFSYYFPHHIPK